MLRISIAIDNFCERLADFLDTPASTDILMGIAIGAILAMGLIHYMNWVAS
jgi:hypothetical protein